MLLYIFVGSFSAVIKAPDLALCGLSAAEAASEVYIPTTGGVNYLSTGVVVKPVLCHFVDCISQHNF